jgi:phosphoserine phosphatase RsbU/P
MNEGRVDVGVAPQLRVLAVDDEPGIRRAIARSLAPRYLVDQAANAREALELAGRIRYDIAIVDVRMPEVDGFELLEALKIESPETEIIMITGSRSDMTGKIVRAIGDKAFYFLEKPFEKAVLQALVDRAAEITLLARQNREYLGRLRDEARRLEEDLETARRFQLSLLPPERPRHPRIDLHAHYEPHRAVGGDLYDFYPRAGGSLTIALADVAGHGVSAALLAGMFKVHLEAVAALERSPREVLRDLNRRWVRVAEGRFATFVVLEIDPDAGRIVYASAGHPPALVARADGTIERLGATGIPLGIFPQVKFEEATVNLGPQDILFLYTDGLSEAESPEGEYVSLVQLEREVMAGREGTARELVTRIRRMLAKWVTPGEPADDVTLIAAKRLPGG